MSAQSKSSPGENQPSAIELFALSIFGWCRSHPDASLADFLQMWDQVKKNVADRKSR